MAPGITLYIIELMEGRDDRGNMSGAFIPDELERDGLFSRALLNWLKWEAEGMMRDFLKSHAANAPVDLPDTAAQDSASKSNNPAVSG